MRKDLSWRDAQRWHHRRGRRAMASSVAVLGVGVVLAYVVATLWQGASAGASLQRFRTAAEAQPAALTRTLDRYSVALAVTTGYLEADPSASEGSFERFASSLDLSSDYPALRSVAFIRDDQVTHTLPVVFVAPPTAQNGLLGFDLSNDVTIRSTLLLASTNDGLAVTPPFLDSWARSRMLMATPVHRGDRIIGWVGASIDADAFADEVFAGLSPGISGSLVHEGAMTPVGDAELPADQLEGYRFVERVDGTGADWRLTYVASPAFTAGEAAFPWEVFGLALIPATLAATALFFVGRSRVRALLLAERLGRDLAVSEARAQAVMDAAIEAIVTTDDVGTIESANPAAEVLLGWPAHELVGQPLAVVLPALELVPGQGLSEISWGPTEKMLNAHRRDGSVVHVDVSLAPTSVEERPMYILIARDATLRKLHEDQLTHQATHDPLTGLANRQLFDELLVRAVYRGDRSKSPVAVLYVDLDGFKEVNDVFGHQAGDRVLAEASRRLEAVVRPGDVVARLGGDEFAVLCENLQMVADSEKIAGRIVEVVSRPVPVASGVAEVTASVGVAVAQAGEGASSVLSRADQAMYEAKRAGKCGWKTADPVGV